VNVASLLLCGVLLGQVPAQGPAPPAAPTSVDARLAGAEAPPAGLRCLLRHYGVVARVGARGWEVELPDGRVVAWDDGKDKSATQRIRSPDLQDTLAVPYPAGPVVPITVAGGDPGRARHEGLLSAVYGVPGKAPLQSVRLGGGTVRVHERIAPALRRVARQLGQLVAQQPKLRPFIDKLGGGFVHRRIKGTRRLSAHSWGIAVDINPHQGDYWRWQRTSAAVSWRNRVPHEIVAAFEAEGFIWGGRWYHYDTPHFEYRPELLDPACRPRQPPR